MILCVDVFIIRERRGTEISFSLSLTKESMNSQQLISLLCFFIVVNSSFGNTRLNSEVEEYFRRLENFDV